ncbi:hypothetical protein ABXZ88_003229 [Vibrio fluvialis]
MMTMTEEQIHLPLSRKLIVQHLADAGSLLSNYEERNHDTYVRLCEEVLSNLYANKLPSEIKLELMPILFTKHESVERAKSEVRMMQFDTYSENVKELDEDFISSDNFEKIDVTDTVNEILFRVIVNDIERKLSKFYDRAKDIEEWRIGINNFVTANA